MHGPSQKEIFAMNLICNIDILQDKIMLYLFKCQLASVDLNLSLDTSVSTCIHFQLIVIMASL